MTDEKIQILIDNIKMYIDEGWSIVIARKKALSSDQNRICKKVMASRQYKELLNDYLKSKNLNYFYEIQNGKLNCKTGRRKKVKNVGDPKP